MIPSPHRAGWQVFVQASLLSSLPSSQRSPAVRLSTTSSPQRESVQFSLQRTLSPSPAHLRCYVHLSISAHRGLIIITSSALSAVITRFTCGCMFVVHAGKIVQYHYQVTLSRCHHTSPPAVLLILPSPQRVGTTVIVAKHALLTVITSCSCG